MQRSRRHDPLPWTWEIPVMILAAVLLTAALGVHLGRAAANLLAGAGWTWPARDDLLVTLPAVLGGDAAAGLPGTRQVAGPQLLAWSIAATELVLLAAMLAAVVVGLRRWGPHRLRGMATRAEAEAMLGRTRLRKVAPVVRPDLYGKRASTKRRQA